MNAGGGDARLLEGQPLQVVSVPGGEPRDQVHQTLVTEGVVAEVNLNEIVGAVEDAKEGLRGGAVDGAVADRQNGELVRVVGAEGGGADADGERGRVGGGQRVATELEVVDASRRGGDDGAERLPPAGSKGHIAEA